ncbi:phospholipase D-like domain-containing protein [Thermodesulfobacteriota bacterium]
MLQEFYAIRHLVIGFLTVLVTLVASAHVVLYKRDSRAAVAWVGLIWIAPVVGPLLYILFGINRIRRRAERLRAGTEPIVDPGTIYRSEGDRLEGMKGPEAPDPDPMQKLTETIVGRPLMHGNAVAPLVNGDEAYPAMLEAIEGAKDFVVLSTFIFDNDGVGRMFREALAGAVDRGVEVRVLIDAVGARYSFPSIIGPLGRRGVTVSRFIPALRPGRIPYVNLRIHRKILVVDGRVGFTGGINIRSGHVLAEEPKHPIQDLHFRIEGPVVTDLMAIFADDWAFCNGERLEDMWWFPPQAPRGSVAARGIVDGPDEDFEKLRFVILAALAYARSSIRIVTPYFVPDSGLITSLVVAAMRGVQVDILLPEKNNQRIAKWASTALQYQLLERGCRIFMSPPPFDHTKLMLVDDRWALIGSANWDARSLRLNFEFNVECYDKELAGVLGDFLQEKFAAARPVSLDEVEGRSIPIRLRDGMARLFTPYL